MALVMVLVDTLHHLARVSRLGQASLLLPMASFRYANKSFSQDLRLESRIDRSALANCPPSVAMRDPVHKSAGVGLPCGSPTRPSRSRAKVLLA